MPDFWLTVGTRAVRRLLLCYHQDGSEPEAERLHSYLSRLLPLNVGRLAAPVFADEQDAPGTRAAAEQAVDALVVVVGPTFRGRVSDHRDPVRRAIEAAFARGIPVVPIDLGYQDSYGLPYTLKQFEQLSAVQLLRGETTANNARVLERLRVELATPRSNATESEAGLATPPAGGAQSDTVEGRAHELPPAPRLRGIGSGVAGFVGPTLRAPAYSAHWPVRSFEAFQRDFGGPGASNDEVDRFARAAKSYFDNGGGLLYVSRVHGQDATPAEVQIAGLEGARFEYRSPGSVGNGEIVLTRATTPATSRTMHSAPEGTVIESGAGDTSLYIKRGASWHDQAGDTLDTSIVDLEDGHGVQAWFVTLSVTTRDSVGRERRHDDLALSAQHARWIGHVMAQYPTTWSDTDSFAIVLEPRVTAFELDRALFASAGEDEQGRPRRRFEATGGSDGTVTAEAYAMALDALDEIEDVELVAAPGYGALPNRDYRRVQDALVAHAERLQRVAVLELPPQCTPAQARVARAHVDSTRAAFFYPWLIGADGETPDRPLLPATGFVCGILARTSVSVGMPRPLTNERLHGAMRPVLTISSADESELVPRGVNCVRLLAGSGCRLRGGRLASSNATWRFVNLRRYIDYVGGSIARGIGWALFEPSEERTWARLRESITEFLREEWRCGRLVGSVEDEAFFVRCGVDTMTHDDIANGRLVSRIGFAASFETPCALEITAGPEALGFREYGAR